MRHCDKYKILDKFTVLLEICREEAQTFLIEWQNKSLPVLLGSTGGEGSKSWHEEVETGEGHHVDSEFPQVSIELTGEPEAGGDTGHGGADQMVQVSVGGGGEFQGTEADIVESLVVNAVGLVCVLDQLVD